MDKIIEWFDSTQIHQQIMGVDAVGLFTNPWFAVPFGILFAWMLYKQSWKEIVIIGVIIGCWWFTGTEYMNSLFTQKGEIRVDKVLPIVFGGAAALGLVIYLLFGRSD